MRPRDPSPGRRILLQRWKSQRASCPVPLLSWIFSSFGLDGWCMTKIEADYSTRAGRYLMNFQAGVQWDGNEMFHVEHWLLVHASAAA